MKAQQDKGKLGEAIALKFLEDKGWHLVAKNYRYRRGEIDLIMQDQDVLVFVEVKLRQDDRFGTPESFVSEAQQALIIQTAEQFIWENNWEQAIRFDIVSILMPQPPEPSEILHLEDAFY